MVQDRRKSSNKKTGKMNVNHCQIIGYRLEDPKWALTCHKSLVFKALDISDISAGPSWGVTTRLGRAACFPSELLTKNSISGDYFFSDKDLWTDVFWLHTNIGVPN